MSHSPPIAPSDSWLALRSCLRELPQGPWQFIQLRDGALTDDAIDGDDVDLLGTRESAARLLEAAFGWVRAGRCHLRVKATQRGKTSLYLISTDGRHYLELDLWNDLRQIDQRRRTLTYQDCAAALPAAGTSLQRLPPPLEAAIFIHHLVAKRKNLTDPKQLARLAHYAAACRALGQTAMAQALETTAADGRVSAATQALTLKLLDERLTLARPGPVRRALRRFFSAIPGVWFAPPARLRMLTLMGCDGCGKTSLGRRLAASRNDVRGVYTGKHLYRKWFLYKLLVIFVRPLLFQGREKFDDTFAPLAYLLASLRLRLKLLRPRPGLLLIDRSLMDFLMLARKSDTPRFSAWRWLACLLGTRLPHIHFIVPFERLQERKLEMTRAGHAIYDAEMFHYFSRRTPTDYLAFDNRATLEDSAAALERLVDWLTPPVTRPLP